MPSVMQRIGTPNPRHNLNNKYRAHLDNVDPELSQYNEIIRTRSVDEIYLEKLQPGFEEFNSRQKRKDRRLDIKRNCCTYLEYQRNLDKTARESKNNIDKKGKPPIREIVWQFGNPSQGYGSRQQTAETRETIKVMLMECQVKAEKRYPQFAWGDLIFHADEVSVDADGNDHGSLHLHSSFVPICYSNKQGPSAQVAFERCLKEMGFESFSEWKHDLDNIMVEVLHDYGLERTYMDNNEKHQDSTEWHRQQNEIRQTNELKKETSLANQRLKHIDDTIEKTLKDLDNRIESYGRNSIEEVVCNPEDIYSNILFLAAECDDARFVELDREGRELKKQLLSEAFARAQNPIRNDLEKRIEHIQSRNSELTWAERQKMWEEYNQVSHYFWDLYKEFQNDMKMELAETYFRRTMAKRSYYLTLYYMDECRTLLGFLIELVRSLFEAAEWRRYERKIEACKEDLKILKEYTSAFSDFSSEYRDALKAGKIPCESCLEIMADIIQGVDFNYQQFLSENKHECPQYYREL